MMTAPTTLTRIDDLLHTLIDTLLPPVCAHCGRIGVVLCPDCLAQFPELSPVICACCGRALEQGLVPVDGDQLCHMCAAERPAVAQARAAFLYEEPLSGVIHRLKYDGHFALARMLGDLMAERWPLWAEPVEALAPVPLHARRQRRRGFNQAELLARRLGQLTGLPVLTRSIQRERHTQPQIHLKPDERATNVAGAFAATGSDLQDRHVLLIDDVYTTGSTMNATAEAVLAAGARRVSAYCVARVS